MERERAVRNVHGMSRLRPSLSCCYYVLRYTDTPSSSSSVLNVTGAQQQHHQHRAILSMFGDGGERDTDCYDQRRRAVPPSTRRMIRAFP
eukprot:scaffold331953_cov57-Attheya_sp.AAC.1